MARALPSLNALRAFEAAARLGSISSAAAELNVTHGAVSRQVKLLERVLGCALFRREGTGVRVTDEGERLLPSLTSAFDLMASGVAQVTHAGRGRLSVSCLGTFTMRWLIPRLFDFQARFPEIQVSLSAGEAPIDFGRDAVDLGIRVSRPPWPARTVVRPFLEERMGPVMSAALRDRLTLNTEADLAMAPLLHTATRPDAWDDWSCTAGLRAVEGSGHQTFEHFYFMLEAAAAGLGVAIGPEPLVRDDVAAGRLIAPFGFAASGLSYVSMRPERSNSKAELFEEWLVQQAAEFSATP